MLLQGYGYDNSKSCNYHPSYKRGFVNCDP